MTPEQEALAAIRAELAKAPPENQAVVEAFAVQLRDLIRRAPAAAAAMALVGAEIAAEEPWTAIFQDLMNP